MSFGYLAMIALSRVLLAEAVDIHLLAIGQTLLVLFGIGGKLKGAEGCSSSFAMAAPQ